MSCATTDETFWNPLTGRYERKWAAFEVGICIPRQNGKGGFLEARELAGLFLWGERSIIHSAHEFSTSTKHFDRLLSLIENTPDLEAEVLRAPRGHGQEGIYLRNGQSIEFKTRTGSGGKGFTGDLLVLDEAQILDVEPINALKPTLAARPNVQIIYTGSAGEKDSTMFGDVRWRGVNHDDPDLMWAEWSIDHCNAFCPPNCTQHDRYDDPRSWARANPALGIRISVDFIRKSWNGAKRVNREGFANMHLGVGTWPVLGNSWLVISKDHYEKQLSADSVMMSDDFVLGVDTAPDRSLSCIVSAGEDQYGKTLVEVTAQMAVDRDGEEYLRYDHRPGTSWLAPRIIEIHENRLKQDDASKTIVVIDPVGQAASITEELENAGITVIAPNAREVAQGCGDFLSGIVPRQDEEPYIVHLDQPMLTAACAAADKRDLADGWAWSKKLSASDISPLVAATNAVLGWKKHQLEPESAEPWAFWE